MAPPPALPREGAVNDKVADSPFLEVFNITVAVVALGAESKEQGFFWETERTAVGEQPVDGRIGRGLCTTNVSTYDFCYFLNCVRHMANSASQLRKGCSDWRCWIFRMVVSMNC